MKNFNQFTNQSFFCLIGHFSNTFTIANRKFYMVSTYLRQDHNLQVRSSILLESALIKFVSYVDSFSRLRPASSLTQSRKFVNIGYKLIKSSLISMYVCSYLDFSIWSSFLTPRNNYCKVINLTSNQDCLSFVEHISTHFTLEKTSQLDFPVPIL